MQHLDADARLVAVARPSVKVGGRLYRGHILSAEEWSPFQARIIKASNEEMSERELIQLFRDYGNAIFRRQRWWQVWVGNPTERILRLPPKIMLEVFGSFFDCQRRGSTPNGESPTNTSG